VNNVRTVSDTKRAFYNTHTRPVNSIYRRVVEELMVEMHLLAVNVDFRYDPVYALGVVTTFERFMQGYRPEADRESIFNALCQSLNSDPQKYRQDAAQLLSLTSSLSGAEVVDLLSQKPTEIPAAHELKNHLQAIAANPKFKYSRLFAIGIFTLLESSDAALVKDDAKLSEALKSIGSALNLSEDKVQKDLELYRSNLDKMAQAQAAIADALQADRKKREQREQEKAAATAAKSSDQPKDAGSTES
jgi:photosystem II biogenesis protein Psp29